MTQKLMVVESPAKAKTIGRYLGKDFKVLASVGHVRDLPLKSLGVDVNDDFRLEYVVNEDKTKVINAIAKAARSADEVYLATDYDREGEAIAWHITEACKIPPDKQRRVTFTEITKRAVAEALNSPRSIDKQLVDAQQARRSIDRLVGYPISQLIWQKIRYGLSAGRVQSPALRLIVEREREIRAFVPVEYWTLQALLATIAGEEFIASLVQIGSTKIPTKISKDSPEELNNRIPDQIRAEAIKSALDGAAWAVTDVRAKEVKRIPPAPFVTSTLQMEASRKLGFSSRRAMNLAQQLYEGGFITYIRTDSTTMSGEAVQDARRLINSSFGSKYWAGRYKQHDRKVKGAQEAHECIRPTDVARAPKDVRAEISAGQGKDAEALVKVYELVWKRAVASLMSPVTFDQVSVDIVATPSGGSDGEPHLFRATGKTLKFDGFTRLYKEGEDDEDQDEDSRLPDLVPGEPIELRDLKPEQHFTQPPPRYTEASLIKELESRGIGRPSTYASIISTLMDDKRDFTRIENKRFVPTDTGEVTNDFLIRYFGDHFMDYQFTSDMEERLDEMAEGKLSYRPVVESFYVPMQDRLNKAGEVPKDEVTTEATDERCPECGNTLVIKLGRRGKFYGCSNYPNCGFTKPVPGQQTEPELLESRCPQCGSQLQRRQGRFGPFIGCSNYPECKYIEKAAPRKTGVSCPTCVAQPCKRCSDGEPGELVERRGRKGVFFGCSHYPACRHTQNEDPVAGSSSKPPAEPPSTNSRPRRSPSASIPVGKAGGARSNNGTT